MTSPKLMKALVRSSKGAGWGLAWIFPALMLAVILFVFVKSFSNVMLSLAPSAVTRPLESDEETVQHAAVEDAALSQRQRMQLPYYAKCFQSPTFTSGPLNGECEVLHMPRTSSIVHPVQTFREQSTIRIDVSACAFYLNSTAVGADDSAHAIDLMQPFEVSLRPNSTDHDVFLQVYCDADFAFLPKLAPYLPLGRPVSVLDAGTNIGLAAILFAQLIKFNGEVMAVDANPGTLEVMRANTEFLGATVTPVEAAIVSAADAAATPTLTFAGQSDQYWGFRVDHKNWQHSQRVSYDVQTRSLPMLKAQSQAGRFDLIKLDIEGEELHILPDAPSRAVLCEARCIFMELHERFEPGCNAAFTEFLEAGCGPDEEPFQHITTTGEYMLYCHPGAFSAS